MCLSVQNAQIQIHPTHAQSFIRAFALHWYILYCFMILLADSGGPDQTARMRSLIWAFAVRICPKTPFRKAQSIYHMTRAKRKSVFRARMGLCTCAGWFWISAFWHARRQFRFAWPLWRCYYSVDDVMPSNYLLYDCHLSIWHCFSHYENTPIQIH